VFPTSPTSLLPDGNSGLFPPIFGDFGIFQQFCTISSDFCFEIRKCAFFLKLQILKILKQLQNLKNVVFFADSNHRLYFSVNSILFEKSANM
jgi:hypothetical protein